MASSDSLRLVLPSKTELIDLVHEISEKMARIVGFDADEALDVGLAVREAVINAMVHGNREDPGLQVEIELSAKPERLRIRVRDQGGGFEHETTADPREGDALMKDSGRGLLMMRAFVDDVDFEPHAEGMEVTLTKYTTPSA